MSEQRFDEKAINDALARWMDSRALMIELYVPKKPGHFYTASIEELGLAAESASIESAFDALIDMLMVYIEDSMIANEPLPPRAAPSVEAREPHGDG